MIEDKKKAKNEKTGKQSSQNKEELMKKKMKNNIIKLVKVLIGVAVVFIAFRLLFPERFNPAVDMSVLYAKEMISIFPAVLLMMGLADVWIPADMVKKYLGEEAGIKGKLLAIVFGTLPTGPMYVAFPLAAELLRKKASISNIIIFLGVWASLKIPQIGVEIQFLGIRFAVLRFIFTLISVVLIGLIIEKMMTGEDFTKEGEIGV